ncbi:translation elongation factor Ts [Candidatus Avelusimicrobium aviculae]|uniref:translation elongation factor Ts n=1 Tax=Candidatus Avelusimicrobium aviculae TaxID=3416206 RepID=UPI003D0BABFC
MSLAEDIKVLREKTGAGLMDCKKALLETKNDMEQAIVFLRKKGLADMAKRSDRETKEGRVSVKTNGKNYAMVYLGCETDFVAKTEDFIKLADELAEYVLAHPEITDYANDEHIKSMIAEKAPKFGENTTLKGAYNWTPAKDAVIEYYIHADNKKASLLELAVTGTAKDAAKVKDIARGLAMHTVGMQSCWVDAKDIPQSVIDKELEIYRTQALNEGKPEAAIEKMLPGKVKKFAKENCLLEQMTIKDNKKSVLDYLKEESNDLGCELKVVRFVRF